ncbi:MAG TPA: hypothetical protein VGJ15_07830 [Pirellulales bacterium]|jgi:adenosylhomocysteine nucleosidase
MSLSSLFQAWIKNTAKQQGWRAAVDAAKRSAQTKSSGDSTKSDCQPQAEFRGGQRAETSGGIPEPNLPPCHAAVIFALPLEATPWERKLHGAVAIRGTKWTIVQGGLQGRGIVVVHSGVGYDNAAQATAAIIAGHKPKWIISAGLAGGLQSGIKRNDIVIPNAILDENGKRLAIDLNLPSTSAANSGVYTGALLTIDRVAFRAAEKRRLGEKFGAVAVDMETLGVAEACRREKQRFLAVRVICDAVDEELPADVEHLVKQTRLGRRIGAAAGSVIRRPSVVKELWRVRETAILCSQRLASFLEGIIEQLP